MVNDVVKEPYLADYQKAFASDHLQKTYQGNAFSKA
jgi:signal peptidase I